MTNSLESVNNCLAAFHVLDDACERLSVVPLNRDDSKTLDDLLEDLWVALSTIARDANNNYISQYRHTEP